MALVERTTPGGNLYPDGSSTFAMLVQAFQRIAENRDAVDQAIADGKTLTTENLDTLTVSGKYVQKTASYGTKARNYPLSSFEGPVRVDAWGARVVQTAFSKNGGTWQRVATSGVWGPWAPMTIHLIEDANLNDLRATTLAIQAFTHRATTEMNYPWVGKRIVLRVIGDGTYAVQTAEPYWDDLMIGESARREYRNGTWTAWVYTDTKDFATKTEVNDAVAGAGDPLERRATGYPVTIKAAAASGNTAYQTVDPGELTTVDLAAATNQAQFFNTPSSVQSYGTNTGVTGVFGYNQLTYCGVTTNATTVIFNGIHGAFRDGPAMFLVDGEPVDPDMVMEMPSGSVYSAWRLTFPLARYRTIEMSARFLWKTISYTTGAGFYPYRRTGMFRKVGILGDSWIDGNFQARHSIGTRLAWDGGWDYAMSAMGGTGWAVPFNASPAYQDTTRIDPLAAWAPDVAVLWGSINNNNATVEATRAAGQAMIDKLKAARPDVKILLTGHQIAGTQADTYRPMYQALAADNAGVTFADAGLALPNVTGPNDGAHPSPTGAKRTAEWLTGQINAL